MDILNIEYIYIHTHIPIDMHACVHARMHTSKHLAMHAWIHPSIHPSLHTHPHIHTYIHTCMHACIHTCIHTCTHTCIHTYLLNIVLHYVAFFPFTTSLCRQSYTQRVAQQIRIRKPDATFVLKPTSMTKKFRRCGTAND